MWIVAQAVAGQAELDVERGRVAFELESYQVARDRSLEALTASPQNAAAQQLYLDASTAAGLGSRALFELVDFEPGGPEGGELAVALANALEARDWKTIKADTEQMRLDFPLAPDLLLPLWSSTDGRVARLRAKVLRELVDDEVLAADEIEHLYRLRRLTIEVGASAERAFVEAALVAKGEPAPPPRGRLDRLQRSDAALQTSKDPVPALPWAYPDELVDITLRLEDLLRKARRFRHVALAWQQVQQVSDDATAWTREALAWLDENDLPKALAAANAAVSRSTRARNSDLTALSRDRQKEDLAAALLARARVRQANGDPVGAWADYATAVVLAERPLDDKLGEKLDSQGKAAARTLAAKYPGVAADSALDAALRAKDHDAALAATTDARFLLTYGSRGILADSPEVFTEFLGLLFRIEAETELNAGRVDEGRSAIALATVFTGTAHPYWWVMRAALQDRNGEYDAAFASWSVARGLGVRGLEGDLERTYVGPAMWEVAANNLGGTPPEVAAKDEPLVRPPPRAAGPRIVATRPASAPRIGEPFPSFSVDTGYGSLTNRSFAGRVTVLVFWEEGCRECLQMLPAFGSMARRLRREGRDVLVIGVGLDEDEDAFERVYLRGQDWAQLVWAPALREQFGIVNVPTAWVLDTAGVGRYYVDHWLSVDELDGYVRESD